LDTFVFSLYHLLLNNHAPCEEGNGREKEFTLSILEPLLALAESGLLEHFFLYMSFLLLNNSKKSF